MYRFAIRVSFLLFLTFSNTESDEYCDLDGSEGIDCGVKRNDFLTKARYIFYDVNPPEGFNLRRDVYMRMAVFARNLRKENWLLVLPPWSNLYHWNTDGLSHQSRLPWKLFFNITTLSSFAPVIEMSDFLQTGKKEIEEVYVLQHFEDTFSAGNFEDRMGIEKCHNHLNYERGSNGYHGHFWDYGNITAKSVKCLSFHGPASQLKGILDETQAETVMFDHAEVALHDRFGDKTYWDARRSMKFADHLIEEADRFMRKELNSSVSSDGTSWPNYRRTAKGGDYISIHLRRRDFMYGRYKDVPSIREAADQIKKALVDMNLNAAFVATDAPENEKSELKSYLKNQRLIFYHPTKEIKSRYKDGGVAIVEQIICSHARKFYGTHESTFSFRIQEEREIMGFEPETTFNRLCGNDRTKCKPPSKWLIVY